MSTFEFTSAERESLNDNLAIGIDVDGHEVLIGLSMDETAAVMANRRRFKDRILYGRAAVPSVSREEKQRCEELQRRHELARLKAVGIAAAVGKHMRDKGRKG